ncbi:MAG: undecaprenyl-diphosphate phosphatase [Bacteroidetes bacterium]|nr:undecaprenyl-diphosphate phosphatase [Bacteroidota bacterium]
MTTSEAIVLAIVEGLTEFLPVSSTGHMIIASALMGIPSDAYVKTYTVAIQLGAILSVIVLYWKRFFQTINFYFKLLVAFIPAAVIGFLLGDYIDQLLERVEVVGVTLILGGIVFLFIDKIFTSEKQTGTDTTYPTAFKIGLFQCIALVPGVSRSAATIIGGLTQKLTKTAAAEFSFFLAVPTMFAATAYKLLKYYSSGNGLSGSEITTLAIGNIVAFIVALIAIRSFIYMVTRNGFKIFGYYRIIVGAIILYFYFSGASLSIF